MSDFLTPDQFQKRGLASLKVQQTLGVLICVEPSLFCNEVAIGGTKLTSGLFAYFDCTFGYNYSFSTRLQAGVTTVTKDQRELHEATTGFANREMAIF